MHRASSSTTFGTILSGLFVAVVQVAMVGPAVGAADSPVVTPATGGAGTPLLVGTFLDVGAIGYEIEEFFLSGDAHWYSTAAPLTEDGRWNDIGPGSTMGAFTTRVVVFKPTRPKRFRGTVYVEWLNVSGLVDASPDWVHSHIQVARERAAYVLVSAQQAGVNQLKFGGIAPGDPDRYGSLEHPGDSFSYDIFSQAGQAIRDGALLGDLVPRRVIAVGESQSAGRLVTYIDAVQPLVDVYDGFVVHSRFSTGASLSQSPLPDVPAPAPTLVRDDLVPVLVFESETDVAASRLQARQPETADGNFRLWEVAGTAHFDLYGLTSGTFDTGDGEGEVENLAQMQDPPSIPDVGAPGLIQCADGINTGPMHWVFNAAMHWMNRWVKRGTAPPIAPRLDAAIDPGTGEVVFAADSHGNTLGGIRTPYVDVPIATLTGFGNGPAPGAPPTSSFCSIFGRTIPFDQSELAALYPNHRSYVKAFRRASRTAVRSKYLLKQDAKRLTRAAARSDIGK